MEALIITALVLFWLTVTIIAGFVMEVTAAAMKKRNCTHQPKAFTERNISILRNNEVNKTQKIA